MNGARPAFGTGRPSWLILSARPVLMCPIELLVAMSDLIFRSACITVAWARLLTSRTRCTGNGSRAKSASCAQNSYSAHEVAAAAFTW